MGARIITVAQYRSLNTAKFEDGATKGATLGVNLYTADGSLISSINPYVTIPPRLLTKVSGELVPATLPTQLLGANVNATAQNPDNRLTGVGVANKLNNLIKILADLGIIVDLT
jgi:hypothetical protein